MALAETLVALPLLARDSARPGSFYALKKVQPGPGGVGRVTQDVVLTGQ